MGLPRWLKNLIPAQPVSQRPRAERFVTQGFSCPLGELIDLSATGARVRLRRGADIEVRQAVMLRLQTQFQMLIVPGMVAWKRRVDGEWQMGLHFHDLPPGMGEVLEQMARFGFADTGQGPGSNRGVKSAPKTAPSAPPPPPTTAAAASQSSSKPDQAAGGARPRGAATSGPIQVAVEVEDLYAILRIEPGASDAQVQEAYRRLAKRYHPDLNGSVDAAMKFADISKAYSVLSDPIKRRRYDEMRRGSGGRAA